MNISTTELITIMIFIICLTVLVKNLDFLTRRGYRVYLNFKDVRKFEERLEKLERELAELKIKDV